MTAGRRHKLQHEIYAVFMSVLEIFPPSVLSAVERAACIH